MVATTARASLGCLVRANAFRIRAPRSAVGVVLLALWSVSSTAVEHAVERSEADAIVIRFRFDEPLIGTVIDGARRWRSVRIPGLGATDAIGWPQLPVCTALVGVPPDASIGEVVAEPLRVRPIDGPPVAPVPRPVPDPTDPSGVVDEVLDPAWDVSGAVAVDVPWAEAGDVFWVRNRRVAAVHVYPVRTQPGARSVRFAEEMRVRIPLVPVASPSRKSAPARYGEDPLDPEVDRRLLNGPQSRGWLRSEPPRRLDRGDVDYFSSSPNWVELRTTGQGVCRITGRDLADAGVELPIAHASGIRVFVGYALELPTEPPHEDPGNPEWMTEVAITVEDGGDGRLDATGGDRIEFFATAVDGYPYDLGTGSSDSTFHFNEYTAERVYWLTWDGNFAEAPRRIPVEDARPEAGEFTPVEAVTERVHLEENTFYDPAPKEEGVRWEKWWWHPSLSRRDPSWRNVAFELPAHVDGTPGSLLIRFWGLTRSWPNPPGFWDHMILLRLNGRELPRQDWNLAVPFNARLTFGATADPFVDTTNVLGLLVDPIDEPLDPNRKDEVYLAFIDVTHQRALRWRGAAFAFRSPPIDGTLRYRITDLPEIGGELHDITDPRRPVRLLGSLDTGGGSQATLEFERVESAANPRRYLVSHPLERLRPAAVEPDTPPATDGYLRERALPVDYVVVTYDAFEPAADRLAKFRREFLPGIEDPQVMRVRLSDVYDEFSWGMPDPTAIRNFLKFAYENYRDPAAPTTPRLRYALLLGDADFDHRDYESSAEKSRVPAWSGRWQGGLGAGCRESSWPSDDYMGLFEGPDEWGKEIAVGRLPAEDLSEAHAMVDKTIAHARPERSDWQTRAVFISDDLCRGTRTDVAGTYFLEATEELTTLPPRQIEPVRIYLLDYPDPETGVECRGSTKPTARDAILGAVNAGASLVNYFGHGGHTVMADERALTLDDLPLMRNHGRYHMFVGTACSMGKFDLPTTGIGEGAIKLPGGGAAISYCAAAPVLVVSGAIHNHSLLRALFRGRTAHPDSFRTFGEAANIALLEIQRPTSRMFNLLGDPAAILHWPSHDCELDLLGNGGDGTGTSPTDTLRRGERLVVQGRVVEAESRRLVTDVHGSAHVRVFDSQEFRRRPDPDIVDYFLTGAPIYRGDVPIEEGEFSVSLVLPATLREGVRGPAWVTAFVRGEESESDAFGARKDLTVADGFRPEWVEIDSIGPAIRLEFDGPTHAVPSGASLRIRLDDAQGVCITGLVDGDRATLSFEATSGEEVSRIDLAPLIVFDRGGTSAEVVIPLPADLNPGRHYTAWASASDNLGNRASVAVAFRMARGDVAGARRVFAFPSPAERHTAFFVDVDVMADVTIAIYSVAGRHIRTLRGRVAAGESLSHPIAWDLEDEDGDPVANGSYLYVADVRGESGRRLGRHQGWLAVLR